MTLRDGLHLGGRVGRSEQLGPAEPPLTGTGGVGGPAAAAALPPPLLLPAVHADLGPVVCVILPAVLPFHHAVLQIGLVGPPLGDGS